MADAMSNTFSTTPATNVAPEPASNDNRSGVALGQALGPVAGVFLIMAILAVVGYLWHKGNHSEKNIYRDSGDRDVEAGLVRLQTSLGMSNNSSQNTIEKYEYTGNLPDGAPPPYSPPASTTPATTPPTVTVTPPPAVPEPAVVRVVT